MSNLLEIQRKRENQRDDFVERLLKAALQTKKEFVDKSFLWDLVSALSQHLRDRQQGIDTPNFFTLISTRTIRCLESIQNDINDFAETKEEEDVLVAQFLESLVSIGRTHLKDILLVQEQEQPENLAGLSQASSRHPPSPP